MKRLLIPALAVLAVPAVFAQAQTAAYRFDKVAEGVYLAVPATPGPNAANIPVIVSDQDVILVGTHLFPAAARALVEQVKTITDKPVRYIVNTHYHASPTAARETFPAGIEVIGHEMARRELLLDGMGKPRPAGSTVAPPTAGMTTRLSLYRGDREIRILYFGKGHSDNDLVVLLPRERIVCTGDLFTSLLPDMSGGNITDWVSTLESLKLQEFDAVLPARGPSFKGKQKIDALQSYLRDVLNQGTELLNSGVSVEDTARRMNLTSHAKDFPEIKGPGVDVNAIRRLETQIEEPEPPFEPAL